MKRLAAAAAALMVAWSGQAWAWGSTGHRLIGVAAAEAFPNTLPAFVRSPQAIRDIGELAREPDRWKGDVGKLHDAMREPYHFIDIDDEGKILGGPPIDAMPATYQEYEAALHASGTDTTKAGALYYAIIDARQQLAKDFAYWRALVAAEKRERNRARKAWYRQDRVRREALVLRDLGVLAHYVGDGSQPLHTSIHYNGWGDYPNPQGFTTDRGTHSMFEGAFVRANVNLQDVRGRMKPAQPCVGWPEPCVRDYLKASNTHLVPFYAMEKAGAFRGATPQAREFTAERLAVGASALRDMVADAWTISRDVTVGWSPVSIQQIESGEVDAWVALQGKD
ncbi:MAG TPA: S1/P1 Nuclease [Caulobacteraceae bacterium]|jgi:hypothetical protein